MEIHPIAEIFPRMSAEEFVALKEDIAKHGLLEPIWLYDGKVLDGRHRYYACQEVGVAPRFREYEGDDPVAFVVSMNLKRRHLDEAQRAMVAKELASLGRGRPGKNGPIGPFSQEEAAQLLNVGVRSVKRAAKVSREAPEPVVEAVKAGKLSLNLASQVIELPEEEQERIASAPLDEIREVAKKAVVNYRAQGNSDIEWYTPAEYVEAARRVMGGFDLDPASSEMAQETVKAESFYTIDDDGLKQPWRGRVWMNPPYAQPTMSEFVKKMVDEFTAGNVSEGIVLTHNYTDTRWFHLAASVASAICFTRGRIAFISPEGKKALPTQGQAFFYFGSRREAFADEFAPFGLILVRP